MPVNRALDVNFMNLTQSVAHTKAGSAGHYHLGLREEEVVDYLRIKDK